MKTKFFYIKRGGREVDEWENEWVAREKWGLGEREAGRHERVKKKMRYSDFDKGPK